MSSMSSNSLITTDVDYDQGGYQAGYLRLPYSHDRSGYGFIPIPIAVLKQGEGPTVLLTGGNHGDEYEGPVALMKLIRRMPDLQISGRIIVIPGLNFPALLNGSRTSPIDNANLNRVFPGKRNGSLTEMIAHYADTVLFPMADFVFDIHAGGLSTNYLPTVLAYPPLDPVRRETYRKIVQAFGAPRVMIMDMLGEDRTYGAAVERQDTYFLCGEFGGHATCSVEGTRIVEQGLERMMHALGVLNSRAPLAPTLGNRLLKVEGAEHYIFAPVAGIFEPAFTLGDEVVAGQLAGRIHDPRRPQAVPVEIFFKAAGLIICTRTLASVEPGDCLGHLASDTDWP
ncbi:succinylglutamate desuccinylase/aspartoacylase family protein [Allopusillimonas ginsengisoli]|uniref:succinylglutamate desuccinylase/aspartoacylase family protein n=1 Tax=Allopusillimonas ginsengisoli TaxID=453575 RepID=UPI00101FC7DF|nr:succinylglutamate desuccinylase/aspartoacylase family protein [Allopusillimonas ginsengisoli]TEA77751.1 succinylglutamate desuccinylase [Allopusillimonas ginsengisoli]